MRFTWVGTGEQMANYTAKLLTTWLCRHGSEEVDPADADVVLASCSHPREYSTIRRARSVADQHRVPLLVGGHEAYSGAGLLAWADYLCVGEAYRLLAQLDGDDWRQRLEACQSVLTRSEPGRDVTPDYHVPWGRLPVIRTAKRSFYALAGRGCRRKCLFCMTSWSQPHQAESQRWLRKIESKMPSGHGVMFVSNDDGIGSQAGSTTLKRFLEEEREKWPMVIRLGVEGLTEERRRQFKKPMTYADIAAAIEKAARIKRQLQLFHIVGFPDDPPASEAFVPLAERMPAEAIRHPRIHLKFTYFEPSPHTPMGRWDVSQLTPFDEREAAAILRRQSGRFRAFRLGRIGRAAWSTVARRLEPEHLPAWAARRDEVERMSVGSACALAESVAGRGVVDGSGAYPWDRVKVSVKRSAVRG